jgi:hypothetical protein
LHSTGSDAPAIQEDEATAAKPARAEGESNQCKWEIRRAQSRNWKRIANPDAKPTQPRRAERALEDGILTVGLRVVRR